jgi:hypothetical protein
MPVQVVQLGLDKLVPKSKSKYNIFNAGASKQLQMPAKQGGAAKLQQTFRKLPILRLLQPQTSTCRENDGAH